MKIQDCNLNPTHIVASPYIRSKPPDYWTEARKGGLIPDSLFMLYHNADYCSIEKSPPYLADPDRKLFSYLGMLLNALCSCFVETNEILGEIRDLEGKDYNPLKRMTGEPWDENASKLQGRMFKLFILELVSSLDLLAELVSLFFPRDISGLKLGRSMYPSLDAWIDNSFGATSTIVTPKTHYLEELHIAMNAEKVKGDSEKDWYKLLQLYRNKLAHIGTPALRKIICHDEKGDFYKFLPRSWPFLWEKDLRFPGEETDGEEKLGAEHFINILIHDDIIVFCESCRKKIFNYIDTACTVLNDAYLQLKDAELNEHALSDLTASERVFEFESFVE